MTDKAPNDSQSTLERQIYYENKQISQRITAGDREAVGKQFVNVFFEPRYTSNMLLAGRVTPIFRAVFIYKSERWLQSGRTGLSG